MGRTNVAILFLSVATQGCGSEAVSNGRFHYELYAAAFSAAGQSDVLTTADKLYGEPVEMICLLTTDTPCASETRACRAQARIDQAFRSWDDSEFVYIYTAFADQSDLIDRVHFASTLWRPQTPSDPLSCFYGPEIELEIARTMTDGGGQYYRVQFVDGQQPSIE